ncbi:MAG: stage II sporulation protein R [Clostridiaceae bacterium]
MKRNLLKIKLFRQVGRGPEITKSSKKTIAGVILIAVAAVTAVSLILINSYTVDLNKGLADNLIRLHVVANSDSPEDQALKRDVRDAVLSYVQSELKDSETIEQTRSMINRNMDRITSIAKETILNHGNNYGAKTTLGSYPFPTKAYGDITLPAGNYQALRIVLGNGEGANWWCVLFPPLCFVDVTHGTVPDSVKEDLKSALSEEEYSIITSADEESEIPVRIKFKIVEIFQDSKVKFAGALNKLFNIPG